MSADKAVHLVFALVVMLSGLAFFAPFLVAGLAVPIGIA